MQNEESECPSRSLCHRMGFLLSQSAALMRSEAAESLENLNIVPRAIGILDLLSASQGMTQQELGKHLKLDRASMVHLIDNLEKEGYVKRTIHPTDRRCHHIVITKNGVQLQKKVGMIAEKSQDRVLSKLSLTERETLKRILIKLLGLG